MERLLPIELVREVYRYDPTYLQKFRASVLPEMMEVVWRKIYFNIIYYSELFEYCPKLTYFEYLSDFEEEEDWSSGILAITVGESSG